MTEAVLAGRPSKLASLWPAGPLSYLDTYVHPQPDLGSISLTYFAYNLNKHQVYTELQGQLMHGDGLAALWKSSQAPNSTAL